MDLDETMLVSIGREEEWSQVSQVLSDYNLQLPWGPGVQIRVWVPNVRSSKFCFL